MGMITDPDELIDGSSIIIDTANKRIQLVVTGLLTTEGVTFKCVYSKLKELWQSRDDLPKYFFPIDSVTDEQYELVNDWNWKDDTTKYLLKTGGWAVKDSLGASLEEWAGIISLGSINSTDQVYYKQSASGLPISINLSGIVNQPIQVYSGVIDNRDYLQLFCRTYAKTYAFSQLNEIGVSDMTYQVYRFPIANTTDSKITHADVVVSGSAPYTGMSITWYATPQARSIGGVNKYFHVIIDGNNGTAEQIYEFVQYKLRQNSDIDSGAGTHIGKITTTVVAFIGDTLYTRMAIEGGVFIDNYQATDINRLVFTDDNGDLCTFPYTSALTMNFNSILADSTSGTYWVYFTSTPSGSYGTSSGVLVHDASNIPMSGCIDCSPTVTRTYAYDTNNQGGRTPATDVNITIVTIGLSGAQFLTSTAIIARSTANVITINGTEENNYIG